MGVASMFVCLICILELVFGFTGHDQSKPWAFVVMGTVGVACVFQLASASLQVEGNKDIYDSSTDPDNIYAAQFFLFSAPLCTRIMLALLKWRDQSAAPSASE